FAWFLNQWRDFSPDGQDYLLSRFEREERSSFWDPDPTLAERVATMRKFPAQPAQPARPVRELIGDFGDLEKQFHVQMYEELDEFRR
ncbi:MAG: hypothetical protein KDA41_19770, partial [Planctomycetales bacterium]|nr:hypothetical protein [Planctomycetales bacterium]